MLGFRLLQMGTRHLFTMLRLQTNAHSKIGETNCRAHENFILKSRFFFFSTQSVSLASNGKQNPNVVSNADIRSASVFNFSGPRQLFSPFLNWMVNERMGFVVGNKYYSFRMQLTLSTDERMWRDRSHSRELSKPEKQIFLCNRQIKDLTTTHTFSCNKRRPFISFGIIQNNNVYNKKWDTAHEGEREKDVVIGNKNKL